MYGQNIGIIWRKNKVKKWWTNTEENKTSKWWIKAGVTVLLIVVSWCVAWGAYTTVGWYIRTAG